MARDENGRWINPKTLSYRERMDQYLESQGLMNYQTQGMSPYEIAQRYANAGVRLATNSQWFKQNYGADLPSGPAGPSFPQGGGGLTPPQVPIQLPAGSMQATSGQRFGSVPQAGTEKPVYYHQLPNGLVVKSPMPPTYSDAQNAAANMEPSGLGLTAAYKGEVNWEDVSTAERQFLLQDKSFYKSGEITKFPTWMQQQILADPNFQWDQLPSWQRTYFELSSTPAGMGAVQGGTLGLITGGPVGAVQGVGVGALIGYGAGQVGYDQRREFWEQDNIWAGAFGLWQWLGEQAEKGIGMGAQILHAAADPKRSVTDVLNRESWNAGASFGEVITPAFIAAMNEGKGELGWDDLLKTVPVAYVLARIGDVLIHPEKYKGEEVYLGAESPIQLDKTWIERIDQAREEIRAGKSYREVMTEMQTGVMAQLGDIAIQAGADPLNALPSATTRAAGAIAEAGGNRVAATALRQSGGLMKAGRRYQTLVQTGQALTIDPNFKVGDMNFLARWVAGIATDAEGNPVIRAGNLLYPVNRGLLDPIRPQEGGGWKKNLTGFIDNLATENPYSRAQTGANLFFENVKILLSRFETVQEAAKYLKALANNDMETWAELGSRFAESPEFYTVLPALKDFNTSALDGLLSAVELAQPNTDALLRIADFLGTDPGKWLDDAVLRKTFEQDLQRLKDKALKADNPEAKAILKDIESGLLTADTLRQIVDLFTGEGKLPWHPGEWKALMLDALGTHFDEWVTQRLMLDKSAEATKTFFRFTGLLKQGQSILLLGGSPGYAIQNGLSNIVHNAITGPFGMMTPGRIKDFYTRFEITPARFGEGVGIGGVVENVKSTSKVHTEAMDQAMRGKGALTAARNLLGKVGRGMPFNKASSMLEGFSGNQALALNMKQFWSQSWRRGIGFREMSPELVRVIQQMGGDPNTFYAAIEAGMNQSEIEAALTGRRAEVQARALVHNAAQKTGMTASQAAEMLETIGVLDTLDTYLKGQSTTDGVRAAFRRAERTAQDWMDRQTANDLTAIAENVRQRVGLEGAVAALDVYQRSFNLYTDAWQEHLFRMGEVTNDVLLIDDPNMQGKAWDYAYDISGNEFRRINARNAANYKGIFDAWGMSGNEQALRVLQGMGEVDSAMGNAYKTMQQERRAWRDKWQNDLKNPKRWDEWHAMQARHDTIFREAFQAKHEAEVKQGAALGEIYEGLYGPAAGEAARLWWEDVVAFNDEIVKRERAFRDSLDGLTREERAPLKQKYYQETKILLIAELEKINGEGIARLERVIKRGGGDGQGMGGSPVQPTGGGWEALRAEFSRPFDEAAYTKSRVDERLAALARDEQTPPSTSEAAQIEGQKLQAESEPSPQPSPLGRGGVAEEVNALLAASEQRKAAEAGAAQARKAAVWDVAEEYWGRGGNYSREIFTSEYDLLSALRKYDYGGIPDLTGLNDPRVTPEFVRQVLETRKAAKEAAGNAAAEQVLNPSPQRGGRKFDATQIHEDTNILRAIALHGGLDLKLAADITGEAKPRGVPGMFTRKGVGIDEMARLLADDGYPIDLNHPNDPGGVAQTTEYIQRARAGNAVYPKGHDFSADIAKAEAAWAEGFESVDTRYPPGSAFDEALFQTEFARAVEAGDLGEVYALIGEFPNEMLDTPLSPAATSPQIPRERADLGGVETWRDYLSRVADETAARVERAALEESVAESAARADVTVRESAAHGEAMTIRTLVQEQFESAFQLGEGRVAAWMEVVDAAAEWYAKMTGESADDFYRRYYGEVLREEGPTDAAPSVRGRPVIDWVDKSPVFARQEVQSGRKTYRINEVSQWAGGQNYMDTVVVEVATTHKDGSVSWKTVRSYPDDIANVVSETLGRQDKTYYQGVEGAPKGAVTFDGEGIKATIRAFEAADFSTLVHENGHVFRRVLKDVAERTNNPYILRDLETIETWAGAKDGQWNRAAEEKFARGFERYIAEGKAPTAALARAFEAFKNWMLEIYKTLTGNAIDVKLTDEVRRVFDRMLGADGRAVTGGDGAVLRVNDRVYYSSGQWTLTDILDDGRVRLVNEAGDTATTQAGQVQALKRPEFEVDAEASRRAAEETKAALGESFAEKLRQVQEARKGRRSQVAGQGDTLYQMAEPTESAAFKNWFGESKVVDENGKPLVVYHGTPTGGFTEFSKFPAYFSEQKRIADIYRSSSASSLTPNKTTTEPQTYAVYLKIKKPFDTRLPEVRRIFESEFVGKGGENWADMYSTGLSERGLPDWTNANDIFEFIKEKGYDFDGIILDEGGLQGLDRGVSYLVFEPEQIKSVENRGTWDPNDPNILFQEADQPFGAYDDAAKWHPQSEVMEEGWREQVTPLLRAMEAEAVNTLTQPSPEGRGWTPEGQRMLRQYMRQVQNEMATNKLATVRWGEKQRDFALLNYNKRYGVDRWLDAGYPYQFYYSRSMVTWAARMLDKPALYANYARAQRQQHRYERDIPERLRGKIKISAPWLPEWMGGSLYIDPIGNLFFPAQALRPIERMMQDKNYQVIEAERILQEWAQDGVYSQSEVAQAARSQEGTVWERAFAEAQLRREAEIGNPLDFFSTMFGPAWYLTTPLNLAGIKVFPNQGSPEKISPLPLGNTARALATVTEGTWAEPVGQLVGLIGKAEDWGRKKLGLPERGEYGEYYTKRQLANMVADGLISPEEAQLAMIEKSGAHWEEAQKRVEMELALRVPTAGAVYALLHGGPGAGAQAFLPSLFGSGLLPAGELEYRGLKQEWNEAWAKADIDGDMSAVNAFYDEYPEYAAYKAKNKDDEELLRAFLRGQIWDRYMELGETNKKQARAELGDLFQQSFLDKETRSYETLDVETLTEWARMLGGMTPLSPAATSPQVASNLGGGDLKLYPQEVTQVTDQFFRQRTQLYPDWFEQQQGYYALGTRAEKRAYLLKNPKLKEFWDWRRGWYEAYPEYVPVFKGDVFDRVDTTGWPPNLEDFVRMYALTGQSLPEGASAALRNVWLMEGMPMGDFQTWVESSVVPGMVYGD